MGFNLLNLKLHIVNFKLTQSFFLSYLYNPYLILSHLYLITSYLSFLQKIYLIFI